MASVRIGSLAIGGGGALSSLETTVLLTVDETMDALRAAAVAGACNCEQVGAQTAQPTRAQILARLPQLPPVTAL